VELATIKQQDGLLMPKNVLTAAKDKKNPLHKAGFTWNIRKAAEERWLEQAGELIRETEIYIEYEGSEIPVRKYISLSVDRYRGGGYREIIEVMKNPTMREQMVQDALDELKRFEERYKGLKEFAELFRVSKEIRKQVAMKCAA
jgi:hypothetical protein